MIQTENKITPHASYEQQAFLRSRPKGPQVGSMRWTIAGRIAGSESPEISRGLEEVLICFERWLAQRCGFLSLEQHLLLVTTSCVLPPFSSPRTRGRRGGFGWRGAIVLRCTTLDSSLEVQRPL